LSGRPIHNLFDHLPSVIHGLVPFGVVALRLWVDFLDDSRKRAERSRQVEDGYLLVRRLLVHAAVERRPLSEWVLIPSSMSIPGLFRENDLL
jgi:hypothetical protein